MARNRKSSGFTAIRIEGGILPPEFLAVIAGSQAKHQAGSDYGLTRSLSLKEEIARYWRIANDLYTAYAERRDRADANRLKVGVHDWLLPLLKEVLGFDDLSAVGPITLGDRTFPITHGAFGGAVPVLLTTHEYDLDRADPRFGEEGRRRAPHGLMQELLNASDDALWGIVANGTKLRLLRDNPSLTRPAYIEADLDLIFAEQLYPDFAALWLVAHASRLRPVDGKASNAILERWRAEAHETGERALDHLRDGVTEALKQLGNGFLQHPENETLRAALADGSVSAERYFQELLRLVYRLLFLFTAEERDLLHGPGVSDEQRAIYAQGYGLARLRDRALKRRHYDRHHDLWLGLKIVFRALAHGEPRLGLPALGGLFAPEQCPALEAGRVTNERLLEAIRALSYFRTATGLARVNYRDMGTEELGSVYESLLELHPVLDVDATPWTFGFAGEANGEKTKGSERKLTGSYYTPAALVNELIKSALEPVMVEALRAKPADPRSALLDLKIVDPACGSGHFLLAAARRMAAEIARIEAGSDTPDEAARQHALREVVQHCIYGVDRNPLAVELCRTALWIETIEPGKPLSFLDHHIQCGDSLVGVLDPKIITDGIPDEAYKPLTGDDKEVCKALKKRNREAEKRARIDDLFVRDATPVYRADPVSLDDMPEESLADIATKRERWQRLHQDPDYLREKHRADLFTAAFFAPKTRATAERVPVTEDLLSLAQGQPPRPRVIEYADELATKHRFFHWHLAFPEVVQKGGFDCVLGNPPWELVQGSESEQREENLRTVVFKRWLRAGSYNVLGGRRDLYKAFLIRAVDLVAPDGRNGFLVPVGFLLEEDSTHLRSWLWSKGEVSLVVHYQNRSRGFFPAVHASYRFVQFVYTRKQPVEHQFSATLYPDTDETERHRLFSITGEELNSFIKGGAFTELHTSSDAKRLHAQVISCLPRDEHLSFDLVAEWHATTHKSFAVASDHPSAVPVGKNRNIHLFNDEYDSWEFFVDCEDAKARQSEKGLLLSESGARILVRDIARNDDTRTLIVCCTSRLLSSYDTPCVLLKNHGTPVALSEDETLFVACFLSTCLADFLIRPYVDKHVKGYVLARIPVIKLDSTREEFQRVVRCGRDLISIGRHLRGKPLWEVREGAQALGQLECAVGDYCEIPRSMHLDILWHFPGFNEVQETRFGVNIVREALRAEIPNFSLPDGVWARPRQDPRAETGVQLAAILKAMSGPLPTRQVRLAALLALEPRLLLPYLDEEEAANWRRLIGPEADPLPSRTPSFIARADAAWGAAVRNLRTNGHLIEDILAGTWAPGAGLDRFATDGWPDGRARMVLQVLQRQATDTVVAALPTELRDWVDAAAA